MKFLRAGYKTNTWWEEECEEEQFDACAHLAGLGSCLRRLQASVD